MPHSDLEQYIEKIESIAKGIKEEIFKISWYMRGGVTANDLLHIYGYEDRTIMSALIKENIETTQKTKISFI